MRILGSGIVLTMVVLGLCAFAFAAPQEEGAPAGGVSSGGGMVGLGAGLGVGLVVIGAGIGISKVAASSVESIARQPEASGDIRGSMIITAALIEGVALFAAVICLLTSFNIG